MRLIRLFPDDSNFRFVKWRVVTFPLSAFIAVMTLVLFMTQGLNYGIDFTGGTLMELQAKSGQADIGNQRQRPVIVFVEHRARAPEVHRVAAQPLQGDADILQHRHMRKDR